VTGTDANAPQILTVSASVTGGLPEPRSNVTRTVTR
jgi:hypothetical protein